MLRAVALLAAAGGAAGHGVLVTPISRALQLFVNGSDGLAVAGNCPGHISCVWYTQDTVVPKGQPTTVCDKRLRTMGVTCNDPPPGDFPCTPGAAVPWCAPGTAPVASPCGVFAGAAPPLAGGRDMRDLPGKPMATWRAGSVAEVAWAITANHGGGYAYRLCPAGSDLAEECFQRGHLAFHGTRQWIVDPAGKVLAEKEAVRLSNGTWPRGSQWTQNPFPQEEGTIPAIPGLPKVYGRGPFNMSVLDAVQVPADLPAGRYVLSWRWDAEQTKQVWAQCGDVIVESAVPQPPPAPARYVPSGKHVCSGASLGLDVRECDAWVDFFDSLNGAEWPRTWGTGCDLRLDPCGCGASWRKAIHCSSLRDFAHITELYLLGDMIRGTLPASISHFTRLEALSLVDTQISGSIPESIGELTGVKFMWLDHNAQLGGAVPQSVTRLAQLQAFELHECNFTGPLPPLPFRNISDCHVDGNTFACPLPPGAETCGAKCA
eukprot:TRINITY_DN657_c0_g1_i1.p2 TRINITY_DN657_c0_g1~~TRINITY_DN657_c0_g1_i1.p2  ORF type:complete len:489 (+),score=163.50 TRINITY_DN657_c0_g1_i1:96-1562(+)